jgi:hypothetical protein
MTHFSFCAQTARTLRDRQRDYPGHRYPPPDGGPTTVRGHAAYWETKALLEYLETSYRLEIFSGLDGPLLFTDQKPQGLTLQGRGEQILKDWKDAVAVVVTNEQTGMSVEVARG